MCRAGGRRCPSSKHPNKEQRDKTSARRRQLYALKKGINSESANKVTEIKTSDNSQREPMKLESNQSHKADVVKKSKKSLEEFKDSFTKEDFIYKKIPQITLNAEKKKILSEIREHDKAQEIAIKHYIGNQYYYALNKALREGETPESIENMSEQDFRSNYQGYTKPKANAKIIRSLDKAIEEHKDGEIRTVFRGIRHGGKELEESLNEGDTLDFKSFSSTTTEPGVAYGFSSGIVFEMQTDKGLLISGGEQEVILPRNVRWCVAGKRRARINTNGKERNMTIIQLVDDDLVK